VHVLSVRVSGLECWSHVWPLRPSALNWLLQNSLLSITHRIHSNAFVYIIVTLTKSIVTSASIVTRRENALFSLLSDNCRVSGETPNMLQYSRTSFGIYIINTSNAIAASLTTAHTIDNSLGNSQTQRIPAERLWDRDKIYLWDRTSIRRDIFESSGSN
jgi:hypothetical protein